MVIFELVFVVNFDWFSLVLCLVFVLVGGVRFFRSVKGKGGCFVEKLLLEEGSMDVGQVKIIDVRYSFVVIKCFLMNFVGFY